MVLRYKPCTFLMLCVNKVIAKYMFFNKMMEYRNRDATVCQIITRWHLFRLMINHRFCVMITSISDSKPQSQSTWQRPSLPIELIHTTSAKSGGGKTSLSCYATSLHAKFSQRSDHSTVGLWCSSMCKRIIKGYVNFKTSTCPVCYKLTPCKLRNFSFG